MDVMNVIDVIKIKMNVIDEYNHTLDNCINKLN